MQRAAKVIRKAGQRGACPFVCSHSNDLHWACGSSLLSGKACNLLQQHPRLCQCHSLWKGAVTGRPRREARIHPAWSVKSHGKGSEGLDLAVEGVAVTDISTQQHGQQQRNAWAFSLFPYLKDNCLLKCIYLENSELYYET